VVETEVLMNWDQLQGDWKQMKGSLHKKWGKLTDDDLAKARGDRLLLTGLLQERYGIQKEQAEKELDDFIAGSETHTRGENEVATEGAPVDSETLKIGMKP
jgi:uncharacterized protein YjbJ (UPF0337 family)